MAKSIARLSDDELTRLRRDKIAHLQFSLECPPHLPGNVALAAAPAAGGGKRKSRSAHASCSILVQLTTASITSPTNFPAASASRVAIARSLALFPQSCCPMSHR